MKTKLRLIVTEDCKRSCEGCCNKDWDIAGLPVVGHYNYKEVIISGGEPLLYMERLLALVKGIRKISSAKIYVYTAEVYDLGGIFDLLDIIDGLTVTLHTQKDVKNFLDLNNIMGEIPDKSLRLNIFEGVDIGRGEFPQWKIKRGMKWIKNCPLPKNEEMKRLSHYIWEGR